MNRDDRLFALTGGSVVAAVTTLFLVFAGGITGPVDDREPIVVAPIPATDAPGAARDVVPAALDEVVTVFDDDLVRSVVAGISSHPKLAAWLVNDNLVMRFVTAVEAVADGYSPRDQLDFLEPWRPFVVREDDGNLVIAAGTYRRYDLATEVLSSVDAEAAVALYRELEPVILEARRDVAWHRGDFEDRLRLAIDHLLEVEVPEGPVDVEQRSIAYAFADDDLERLSDAQRQLVRMGRSNAVRVQGKLREIRAAFGWPRAEASGLRHAVISGEDEAPAAPAGGQIAEALVDEPARIATDEQVEYRLAEVRASSTVEPTGSWVPGPVAIAAEPDPAPVEATVP
jgi:hypothetical protein